MKTIKEQIESDLPASKIVHEAAKYSFNIQKAINDIHNGIGVMKASIKVHKAEKELAKWLKLASELENELARADLRALGPNN